MTFESNVRSILAAVNGEAPDPWVTIAEDMAAGYREKMAEFKRLEPQRKAGMRAMKKANKRRFAELGLAGLEPAQLAAELPWMKPPPPHMW